MLQNANMDPKQLIKHFLAVFLSLQDILQPSESGFGE